ncbi:MAG TPA: CBS domain-containing protein [bacterium]|nr:CBS domain-containing protein [bacterium]HPN42907.1 CBS domain-containing protein [bacterium]
MKTLQDILDNKEAAMITVPEETTIYNALKIMVEKNIGAIVVTRDGQVVGIWSERDLMRNTLEPGFDPRKALIKDYMTTDLLSAPYDEPLYKLLDKLVGRKRRHLLIEKDGQYIGFISLRDVMHVCLLEKSHELEDLNTMVSWEYYENWRWTHKKK